MEAEIPPNNESSSKTPDLMVSSSDANNNYDHYQTPNFKANDPSSTNTDKLAAEAVTHASLHKEWIKESHKLTASSSEVHDQNTSKSGRTTVVAISELERAKTDFAQEGATPRVKQEFESAIKNAEIVDAKLDKIKLQAEIDRLQTQIKALNLGSRTNEIKASIDNVEKSLPQGQRQTLAGIDQSVNNIIRQHDALVAKIKDHEPTQAEQQTLIGYEVPLDKLIQQRESVYKLPDGIAKEREKLNKDYEYADRLNQAILKDNTLLHFTPTFRVIYAEALAASGDKTAADKQLEKIAASDPGFFGSDSQRAKDNAQFEPIESNTQSGSDPSAPGAGTLEAFKLMEHALNLSAHDKNLSPEARVLFEQARKKADAQLDTDKSELQAKIQNIQKRFEASNAKLAPYDHKLKDWLKQNPEAKKRWDALTKQIVEATSQLYDAQLTDAKQKELQQRVASIQKQKLALLPSDIQQLGAQLLPEQNNRETIKNELMAYSIKLGTEVEAAVWVRAYEAAALKKSGDSEQVDLAQQLLKEALVKVGGTPQVITKMALDILQSGGINAAKPIFRAAIDAADLAKAERQAKAAADYFIPDEISTPEAAAVAAEIVANPDNYTWPQTEKEHLLIVAPIETRRAYAFALFNSGSKKDAIDLLKQMHTATPSDVWTVAALQVAQESKTTRITDAEITNQIKLIDNRSQISYYVAGGVDMLVAGLVASRGVPAPIATALGTTVSTPVFAGIEYLINNGRVPSAEEIELFAASALGGAAIESAMIPTITSGALRVLGGRAATKVQPILEMVAPGTTTTLGSLRGAERILATKDATDTAYSIFRTSGLSKQYPQAYSQLWRNRLILGAAYKSGTALGIGSGIYTSNFVISSMYRGVDALTATPPVQLTIPSNAKK